MTRKPEDIRTAIDSTLSGASHDPALYQSVVNASKGDSPPMKRKLTLSMAFVLILILLTGTVAVAATYRGVSWFLTERENQTIDPDYLMNILEQTHNSERLDIHVVDAYWDGVNLSIACNFAPKDPSLTFSTYCYLDALGDSEHDCSNENADLLLNIWSGTYSVNITTGTEVNHAGRTSYDTIHEEDGSITLLIAFVVNDMSQPVVITLPVQVIDQLSGTTEDVFLHVYLPVMADPIAPHEHNWTEAICVAPETCTICGRTRGWLGKHEFIRATCIKPSTCIYCGTEHGTLSLHHQYGDDGYCILCNKYYEHADKTK